MRIKGATTTLRRKKKYFKIAKSYYSDRGSRWRLVKQQVERSLRFAFIDRRKKKRVLRRLWIVRINAAARTAGLSYSRFINILKKNDIQLNRKSLAHLAVNDSKNFQRLLDLAKTS